MRSLLLQSNVAGEVRVSTRRLARAKEPARQAKPVPLVYSDSLQDSMSTGHFATKVGYGWQSDGKQFTSAARRRLKEFGALTDGCSLTRCVFLTGTLPGSSKAAVGALAAFSSWVTSRLCQWLRDQFRSVRFFGVWEYQRRGALHLHVVVQCATDTEAEWLKRRWKRRWTALIDGVGKRSGIDLWARPDGSTWQQQRWRIRTDAQTVERSVARYLSKYLGKTANTLRGNMALPPASWWFASRNLRQAASDDRCRIKLSSLDDDLALNLYATVAGEICSAAAIAYPVLNQFDISYFGVIGLMPSAVAGALMRQIRDSLPIIQKATALPPREEPLSIAQIAVYFAASRSP